MILKRDVSGSFTAVPPAQYGGLIIEKTFQAIPC